ncbi:MAG: hypothetical protein WC971_00730 [Coriobacteriia bacterium]
MSRKSLAAAFALVALVAALAAPIPASAAAAASDRVPLDVQFWPEGEPGRSVIIVGLKLPDTVALPATVRMPLPADAQITWVGELDGGDGSLDETRTYDVVRGSGGPEIVIRLTKYRDAQYEATYRPIDVRGTSASATLEWVQTTPCSQLALSVRLPGRAGSVRVSPASAGAPQLNQAGELLYTLQPLFPKTGDRVPVHAKYVRGGAKTAAEARRTSTMDILLSVLGVALAAAVGTLVLALKRQGRSAVE